MDTPAGKAFLQEVLDGSHLYRLGAAMRLRVPFLPGRNVIGEQAADTSDPAQPQKKSGLLKPALIAAAIAGSGLVGGAALRSLWTSDQPGLPNTTVVNSSGDLLEWLEAKGHAP